MLLRCGPGPRRDIAQQLATGMPVLTRLCEIDSDCFRAIYSGFKQQGRTLLGHLLAF
jgi:hypothetical protein